jgi:DNA ligase 1
MPCSPSSRRHFLAALAAWPLGTSAAPRLPLPGLLLAEEAPPDVDPGTYLVSEKLDGVRAYWDGHRLSFRSGRPIAAPAWFLDRLPAQPLDGELWLGRGRFDALSAAVRRTAVRDDEWHALRYMVFELPGGMGPFAARAAMLRQIATRAAWPQLVAVDQETVGSRSDLRRRLDAVVHAGGEGLMLHRADAPYLTGRSKVLLKLKPQHDAEATVVGHLPGTGRHEGRLGALQVRTPEGREFMLGTGFSDTQRKAPPPRGSVVTFSYRGHTETGLPRFASFLRARDAL